MLLAVWGLRSDLAACTASPERDVEAQPLVELDEDAVAAPKAEAPPGGNVAIEDLSTFGIVGPVFTGLGVDAYSAKCDPFSDPYGSCL